MKGYISNFHLIENEDYEEPSKKQPKIIYKYFSTLVIGIELV
ncbi:hypothetical protein LCGC14_0719750 [marine sediment metagenome]|uniref:Uncharacterized protein n=1 Tax=marine sediment metagenome TaxID=412755 RepID=A0A0F9TK84_9ZZZZ